MTKLLLSTSNAMSGGPSVIRRTPFTKSNTEFTNSLRSNFKEAWKSIAEQTPNGTTNGDTNGTNTERPADYTTWTSREDETVFIPSLDLSGFGEGLAGDQSAYDITVKLFFLPTTDLAAHRSHVQEAIGYVLRELRVSKIDLLIMSFPGVTFDADDDDVDSDEAGDNAANGDDTANGSTANDNDTPELRAQLASQVATWQSLEELHTAGTVAQLGVAEFGSERLRRFLREISVRPSLDQINVRDCCVVPKSLILFGKRERIELSTHNDSTNILPKGTIRELLGGGNGAGILGQGALCGEVEPQWVVKYTAVVKDRGVVENKGYFAMAKLLD